MYSCLSAHTATLSHRDVSRTPEFENLTFFFFLFVLTLRVSQQVIMPFREQSGTGSSKSGCVYVCRTTPAIKEAKQTQGVQSLTCGQVGEAEE